MGECRRGDGKARRLFVILPTGMDDRKAGRRFWEQCAKVDVGPTQAVTITGSERFKILRHICGRVAWAMVVGWVVGGKW